MPAPAPALPHPTIPFIPASARPERGVLPLIAAFAGLRVLVVGETMLDSYLRGFSSRLCREAPVPVVDVSERYDAPGGAANTALNLRALGATVRLLSVIGEDAAGTRVEQLLRAGGIDTARVTRCPTRHTLTKERLLADGQLLLRVDQGSTEPLQGASEQALIGTLTTLYPQFDAVILSDYGYGILTPAVVEAVAALQRSAPRLLVADSRHLARYRFLGVTAVKPNYDEATRLLALPRLDAPAARAAQMVNQGDAILEATGAQVAAVTLDRAGAILFERGRPPYRTYAPPQPSSLAAGAGDTFVAALTLALATGAHSPVAAEVASAAAAIVVAKEGTVVCTANELRGAFATGAKYLLDWEELASCVALHRRQGQRIVFTNGCFDLLHRGHITYLSHAKALGDLLIVGINSDASVCALKGPGRPITTLEDRAHLLAALSCVDYVVPFDDSTPHDLIRLVRPDVFVKGGDYTRDTLAEAPLVEALGGEVHLLGYLDARSTTGIIERIQQAGRL